jgi:hypothetical protein
MSFVAYESALVTIDKAPAVVAPFNVVPRVPASEGVVAQGPIGNLRGMPFIKDMSPILPLKEVFPKNTLYQFRYEAEPYPHLGSIDISGSGNVAFSNVPGIYVKQPGYNTPSA